MSLMHLPFLCIENVQEWEQASICKHVHACFSIQLQILMFYAFAVVCICAWDTYLTLISVAS